MKDVTHNDLDKYYVEFGPYISNCEFRGCSHIKEKKCGVQKAVLDRKIDQGRYERYCKFYQLLKDSKKR